MRTVYGKVCLSLLLLITAACGGMKPKAKGDDRDKPTPDSTNLTPTVPGKIPNETSPEKKPAASRTNPPAVLPDATSLARFDRAKVCTTTRSANALPLSAPPPAEPHKVADPDYTAIKATLKSACAGCHEAPTAKSGGFSYLDSYAGATIEENGVKSDVPGLAEAIDKMRDSVAAGRMPPKALRRANPQAFDTLAKQMADWVAHKLPQERMIAGDDAKSALGLTAASQFTDLGDCMPTPSTFGKDPDKDAFFAKAMVLPDDLKATDFLSFDAAELGRHGTAAYDVEYPLWTDNAGKSRLIHVPVDASGNLQPARFDAAKNIFNIPENTRFYKTFFRSVARVDGTVTSRPIETRIIVVRHSPAEPLYGTYVWDDAGTEAKLLKTPYRDGTPWKDLVLSVTVDETKKLTRKYAVPARHRCQECHGGGDDGSFVLGFDPLQINRRKIGEAGRDQPVGEDELAQVPRLVSYGVVAGVDAAHPLPKLEHADGGTETNVHTLRAQGYVLGNCSHCHNPNGYAMKNQNVQLNLSAGQLFHFNTETHPKDHSDQRFVDHNGSLERSVLYRRLAAAKEELGFDNGMPLHTPGGPDCHGVTLIGRWVRSFDSTATPAQLDNFAPPEKCTESNALNSGDFDWTEQDFTGAAGAFHPRRGDWADPINGMPQSYRDLRLSAGLKALIEKPYPVDFWQVKPECKFPKYPGPAGLPASAQRPWMLAARGLPKQPWNQLYYSTPGAYYFTTTCSLCHGKRGTGDGAIGRQLAVWSGGSVVVADFLHGMYGEGGANLKVFDQSIRGKTVNLAPNYLIWMAMEGTKIKLPPQAAPYLGTHGAQMLLQIKERCSRQIPTSPKNSSARFKDNDMFREVCAFDNQPVTAPEIQYDKETALPVNVEAQEKWLNKAAINAGWAIFEYLKSSTIKNQWQPAQSECEAIGSMPGLSR